MTSKVYLLSFFSYELRESIKIIGLSKITPKISFEAD